MSGGRFDYTNDRACRDIYGWNVLGVRMPNILTEKEQVENDEQREAE